MTSVFDKLNLRPFERRLVVVVGSILFIVVQLLYVWPHFGAAGRLGVQREKALKELNVRQTEIGQTNKYVTELAKLQGEGQDVPPEDQSVQLMRTVQQMSSQSGVQIQNTSRPNTRTNEFFLEQSQQIATMSEEGALVDFIFKLGDGNSQIRVRDLTIRPDQSRTKLQATIKLVASYQKKAGTRTAPAAGKAPAPRPAAPKPSTPTKK